MAKKNNPNDLSNRYLRTIKEVHRDKYLEETMEHDRLEIKEKQEEERCRSMMKV